METLVRALSARLNHGIRPNASVTAVRWVGADSLFRVTIATPGGEQTIMVDHLVLATPTYIAGKLLGDVDPAFDSQLGAIEYAPIAVVSLGYRQRDIARSLDGFGFLVPRSSALRTLGTVWNSSLFPQRAPDGHVLLTSFVGGSTDPFAIALSEEQLVSLVDQEIAPLLAIPKAAAAGGSGASNFHACFSNVTVYSRALPQYNLGHADRLRAIANCRKKFPNLWLAGNYLRGPSIGACVEQSLEVANEILSRMNR